MHSYNKIIEKVRGCARLMHGKYIPPSSWHDSLSVSSKLKEYSQCFQEIASAYEAAEHRLHDEEKKVHVGKRDADILLEKVDGLYEDLLDPGG